MRDIYCEQESTHRFLNQSTIFLGRQLIDFLLKYFLWVIFYPIYVTELMFEQDLQCALKSFLQDKFGYLKVSVYPAVVA